MPISRERFSTHVQAWSTKAGRAYWPQFLFHYADVTAAAKAIEAGRLLCRAAQQNLVCDVAEPGALAANPEALDYVRLHFRPLNPFHLSTEGIKFRDEQHRRNKHMSIPIALLLDAAEILCSEGVGFSGRKLAHVGEEASFDEAGFNAICFDDVYHNRAPGSRMREIHDRRTAEVVVPGELLLQGCLKHIICRTVYDEMTLRHLVQADGYRLLPRIRVAPNPTEFFYCWGTFIQLLEFSDDKLRLKLFQGRNYKPGSKVRCQIWQSSIGRPKLAAVIEDNLNNAGVSVGRFHPDPDAVWTIHVEDVLAFEGVLPHIKSEIVRPA